MTCRIRHYKLDSDYFNLENLIRLLYSQNVFVKRIFQ